MKIEGTKLYLTILATFVIVFLMNYLGNSDAEDKLYRASLTGLGGAVGIGLGLWFMNKKGKDDDQHHFD